MRIAVSPRPIWANCGSLLENDKQRENFFYNLL